MMDAEALFDRLFRVPQGELSLDSVLEEFGEDDAAALAKRLLLEAKEKESADILYTAFFLLFVAKCVDATFLPYLLPFVQAEWHARHEDLGWLLLYTRSPEVVPALIMMAAWVPEGLKDDEFHVLAKNSTYALSKIDCDAARDALVQLTYSPLEEVREVAIELAASFTSPDAGR